MGKKTTKLLNKMHKQNKIIPFLLVKWATMPWLEGSTSLSHSAMEEELWLNGGDEWKRGSMWVA